MICKIHQQQGDASALVPQDQQTSIAAQQASLSFESNSLSINGSINTSDGAKVSFALDLQVMHASASTSAFTSMPIRMATNSILPAVRPNCPVPASAFAQRRNSGRDLCQRHGVGNFSLKDELKEVRHILKPLLKEFLSDAGMPSDRRSVNQLLHAIA